MTYQIHRYPAELIDVVHLGGNERVVIRPVLPQDADLTRAFFRELPAPARYNRFMTPMRDVPAELTRQFTQIDYANHLALVAEVFAEGRETVIAEARYVRLEDPEIAEFAVSVAEPWQGRKLASLLLGKLARRAAAVGIRRIVGETLADNTRMLALARRSGFRIVPSREVRGLMVMEKSLGSGWEPTACNDSAAISSQAA
ncbi:MAG TPA: GNAT family protein [Hyphomicrobiaceae bacterium]|nr:GNAT family protein [Hyphomicrobiaceae bacterium]